MDPLLERRGRKLLYWFAFIVEEFKSYYDKILYFVGRISHLS